MENKKIPDYVLRISLPYCNLKCIYCRNKFYKVPKKSLLSDDDLIDLIKAAYENGIRRVRWTGGEPIAKHNFLEIVKKTKKIGIKKQYLSTNGTYLYKVAKKLHRVGITRVNISLDTLDRNKFKKITGFDLLPKVIKSINITSKIFKNIKINTVLTKENYNDIYNLINFVESIIKENKISNKKITIRFIELICGGFKGDKKYVKDNYILGEKVIKKIEKKYGEIKPTNFEGDNPMCRYYQIKRNGVIFGIIPHYSVNFRCGGKKCKKLRLNPLGLISNCSIYKECGHNIKNTSYKDKVNIIQHLIDEKSKRTNKDFSKLKHFQSDYSFWRFGIHSKS